MIKTPKQALNKAYLKIKHSREQIDNFKQAVKVFFETSQTAKNESEQEHVTLIINFLNKSFYGNSNYVNINKKNDLVIRSNTSANSKIEILFEVKAPNNPTQMISKENINKKALQQLVLYYLREKITNKNDSIKYLIATNGMEWFIFDAQLFAKYFAHDKKLRAKFEEYINGRLDEVSTEHFYINIAKPAIEPLKDQLEYTYFNIEDYKKYIETNSAENDSKLIELYKIFSPEHLLKLPITNDNNSLNQKFYSELLHIIGLEETKQGSKKIITRKSPDRRNDGSLLESCIYTLDVANFENPIQYGDNKEEQLFNIALELVITWVNRILFLKLLEAQLISFHQGDKSYSFLNPDRLKSYQELNALFFNVLAIKNEERDSKDKVKFPYIPYLNSSLFEKTNLEISGSLISQLDSNEKLAVFNNTVLNDSSNKRLTGEENTLTYLLEFLNAYNFSGDDGDIIQGENKTIINASVLGLIFEKINGYKDGSFFTPSFITMYMCRETIRRAVVDKFKTIEPSIESFDDVKAYTSRYYKSKDIQQFNELINSLTICDPAVGSGHFLVSALNEIIAIKSELGILLNDSNELLNIGVDVINDELVITERSGDLFKYYPNNPASQQIQKTLFHEKQTIIENCLFGVDINPNSVKICRLRLWIELLKNAYYKDFANNELETLPNIDINIKCGNSLISRFDLVDNIESLLSNLKHGNHKNITVDYYRKKVLEYKNAKTKDQKRDLETLIKKIKQEFSAGLYQASLFDEDNKQSEKEAFYNKQNAFEWRFEFPEVLADNGEYKGFDIVIGNPPYISNKEISAEHKEFYQNKYNLSDDLYNYFFTLSFTIASTNGYSTLITSNTFMTINSKINIRQLLQSKKLIEFIPIKNCFDEAAVEPIIVLCQNKENNSNYHFDYIDLRHSEFNPLENRYNIHIDTYKNTPSQVFFTPTKYNLQVYDKYIVKTKRLLDTWWDKIRTSAEITRNEVELNQYRESLKAGDLTVLGLVTDGGQGLATGENSKYLAVREDTQEANRVRETRLIKLTELNNRLNTNYSIDGLSEIEIRVLFEDIKSKHGRKVFGQGYIYSIALLDEIANINLLSDDEKLNGINSSKSFVAYDKGDKDGNKWYVETPFVINWNRENVTYLKENSGKHGQGMPVVRNPQFYFKEGFSWNNILNPNSEYIKARIKEKSINDVGGMSLYPYSDMISAKYIVVLLNSYFMFEYLRDIINNTVNLQINDFRQLPIIIPTTKQLQEFETVFDDAVSIRKDEINNTITAEQAKARLSVIQSKVDEMVYKLYDLTPEEIAIIEEMA